MDNVTCRDAAAAAGLPAAQCEVYKIDLGGGFGRRGAVQDWITQTVLIAKQMPGTPVKLDWTERRGAPFPVFRIDETRQQGAK